MPSLSTSLLRRRLLAAAASMPALGLLPGCNRSYADISEHPAGTAGPLFFSLAESKFVEAACSRLIPDGDEGNGALAAAVPFFIDRQLAGPYGQGQTRYSEAPWHEGTDEQGYQLAYTPAELYRTAIADVNAHCEKTYQRPFADLSEAQQDDVLHQLEDDDIALEHMPASTFFSHLWQNTLEGFLSDPMYGGNRDFVGWKLIGFPGPRYNYVDEITQYGQPYTVPVVGLLGRDGQRLKDESWP